MDFFSLVSTPVKFRWIIPLKWFGPEYLVHHVAGSVNTQLERVQSSSPQPDEGKITVEINDNEALSDESL
jgi:hypothetical protein